MWTEQHRKIFLGQALSWEVKCCWIVVSASDSAKSSAMPLPRRFFHSVRPATVPARSVCSSQFAQTPHRWRRRGPGTRLEQFSVFTDTHRIDLVGFVAPQLRPRKVADLSWIDDAHDVACLMECERDAQAVASSCLQTEA